MYSRKDSPKYSAASGHATYKNVQQLAQEYRSLSSSKDNVGSGRSRGRESSSNSGNRLLHDKRFPVSDSRTEGGHQRPNPGRTYKQRSHGEDLYENARFYKQQAIYNWMNSSEQAFERPTQGRSSGSFKGSSLVTTLIAQNPVRFKNRTAALQFAQDLFRKGTIKSVHGARFFEDSELLYVWQDENHQQERSARSMTSSDPTSHGFSRNNVDTNSTEAETKQKSFINDFFRELEEDFPDTKNSTDVDRSGHYASLTPWAIQRASTASSDSSADTISHSYSKYKNASLRTAAPFSMATSRDHEVIPEETSIERAEGHSLELELDRSLQRIGEPSATRRWPDPQYSYSDNEKQLIEEMKRMKRDHTEIVKSYEDRVSKLMTKMGELRSIAEMLENSGTKPNSYGVLQKSTLLNLIDTKLDQDRKQPESTLAYSLELPPPLPPRPGRGNVVYPNKPLIRPSVKMKDLDWNRIILQRAGDDADRNATSNTIWHSMLEPKIDNEEVERLFRQQEGTNMDGMTLYSDVISQRGKTKHQLVTILEREKSGRLAFTMKALPHPMAKLSQAIATLEIFPINTDRFAELMELFGASTDVDKINAYVKRKGPGNLDHPEYLLYELSKMEHFRERVDFLRFRYRAQWQLFEMDQQLRELQTACDEITNSLSLKNLLETLLAVGNYLNGSSQNGQADGFSINILNKLKDIKDIDDKGNLLEFIMKMYCQFYEVEIDIGCPTRFRLPEPSNMRHAAQVSFDSIHESLATLHAELRSFQDKILEKLTKTESSHSVTSFRTTAEHFFTSAQEVMTEADTHLRETKEVFENTKLYFMYDSPQCTPQDFFQIWAVFLHDCKYYWKLAHRKIAKDRFEFEFKYKGQMSVNSAHGYDSFRASMLRRLTTLHRTIPDRPSSVNQNLKPQLNNWTDTVDAKTPQDVSEKSSLTVKKPDLDLTSSSSPKLLTSEPPASLHKPQPLMNGHQEVPHLQSSSNYENHEDVENIGLGSQPDIGTDSIDDRPPMPLPCQESGDQKQADKQGTFSIKTWLKREPGRPQRSTENKVLGDFRAVETTEPQPKRPSSSTTFSKLRSNFVQKITGSSNNTPKRPNQLSVHNHQNPEVSESCSRPLEVSPSFTPLKITTDFENIDPYMTSLGRDDRQNTEISNSGARNYPYTSSADRRNFDHRLAVGRRGKHTGRNGSDISTEYAGLYHTPPFSNTVSVDRDGYASPNVIGPFNKSDINNNEKHINNESEIDRDRGVHVLSRAPLSHTDHHNLSFQSRDNVPAAKLISGNMPNYKSKSNPRQVRLDVSSAMKYQAEIGSQQLTEMSPSDMSHTDLKVPMREHRPPPPIDNSPAQTETKKESSWRKDLSKLYNESPPSTKPSEEKPVKITLGRAHQRQQKAAQQQQQQQQQQNNLKPIAGNIGSSAIKRDIPPQKPPRTPQMQRSQCHMDLSQTNEDQEKPVVPERSRAQHHAITSLISRFEKNTPSNDPSSVNRNLNKNKKLAMTSTPLTESKQFTEEEDPPPLPPRFDYQYPDGRLQYTSNSNESTLVKTPVNSQLDNKQSQSVPNYLHSKLSTRFDGHFSDTKASLPKPVHSRESTGLSDVEGYTDQLRKAASSSVFDRYKQHRLQAHFDNDSKPTVETARRNLNLVYDRQSGSNANYNTHQPVASHSTSLQNNTPQFTKVNHNHVTPSTSSYGQRNAWREEGSTAVVKPSMIQGAVMDF
ncbi:uncharacterized protein LOC134258764 isoform X1 [Saccostrea cucullata]|uniref:uncharacterized protein LOC134258764 isoform X1 n=1 Tax=Saccostrea cuccullata TaxID=36930 RepID=UPI002ED1B9A3